MQRGRLLKQRFTEGFLCWHVFLKYLLLTAIRPEVVKDKVDLDLVILFFQNLLYSLYSQSNEDKTPFRSFLQKLN